MLGWINLSIESFVVDTFGQEAWDQVLAKSGVHKNWVSSCPYSDKITYDLVVTAAGLLSVSVEQALEAYGGYFVKHVRDNGYTKLLQVLGSNVAEFLQNLNNLHLHLSMGWPSMVAPAFRCEQVTPESLLLHYHSSRPGLWPIVVGVLKSMSKEFFGFELGVELVESRDKGHDHEVFRLTYPYQEDLRSWDDGCGAAAVADDGAFYSMPPGLFCRLHPFHLLLSEDLRVLQAGPALRRVAPGVKLGEEFIRHFKIRHPYLPLSYPDFVLNANTAFLLLARDSMVSLKGQAVPVTLPPGPGAAGEGPRRALLFLLSPRCSNLQDMQAQHLFLSDIPIHDMSRDFILLAEQRQAEADLKEKFERLSVELKAANEKLARTTKWLEDEKARAEALLYRMGGLIACFPGPGDSQHKAGAGGGASSGPLPKSGSDGTWAAPGSEDSATQVQGSIAAVAALLRRAGVRAPAAPPGGAEGDQSVATLLSSGMGDMSPASSMQHSRHMHTLDRIEAVRRELAQANLSSGDSDQINCCELLGEGAYGKVYKGLWKGSVVAVKTIVLPAMMSGAEKREKMAIMEAAISSALSHPNILQTYTYSIRPIRDTSAAAGAAGAQQRLLMGMSSLTSGAPGGAASSSAGGGLAGGAGVHSFEVRLVLEYCDKGNMRDALDSGAFKLLTPAPDNGGGGAGAAGAGQEQQQQQPVLLNKKGPVNYLAVLDTAVEVATAMVHLHGRNVLHADLKARNIMLKSNGAEGRGVSSKVADFGLSVKMDHAETHLSNTYQGTMTHMAPEVLMHGHLSKAADVYAFGIMMWELYTAGHPFRGLPKALFGHEITRQHRRPEFPPDTPKAYSALAARCWDPKASRRPCFEEVLAELKYLRADEPPVTPPLAAFEPPTPQPVDERGGALPSASGAPAASGAARRNSRQQQQKHSQPPALLPTTAQPPQQQLQPQQHHVSMERSIYIEHSMSTFKDDDYYGAGSSGGSSGSGHAGGGCPFGHG